MNTEIPMIHRPNVNVVGVIADTHVPDRAEQLHPDVLHAFKDVDLILHAGDISSSAVLDRLGEIAECLAVCGNNPGDRRIQPQLPEKCIIEIAGGFRIGLVHGLENLYQRITDVILGRSGFADLCATRVIQRVSKMFENVDCIVFGHAHWPVSKMIDGRIFLNPGRSFAPKESACAVLNLDKNEIQIQFHPLGPAGKLTSILNKPYQYPLNLQR